MFVDSIQFNHFRNYNSLSLTLDPGINLLYGDNAQGKTNILEAVYLCGTTRSHRGSRDREMIQFSHDEAHLRMQLIKGNTPYRIDMHLKKNKAKGIAIDGTPIRKATELIGLGSYIFFSPEDLAMVKNGPSERRRFLDMELCQLDKIYLNQLDCYNKILEQRNKLLKEFEFREGAENLLDVYDEQMAVYGSEVIRRRKKFINQIEKKVGEIHRDLSGNKETLEVIYEPETEENEIEEKLKSQKERDIRTKFTNSGPHRDDLCFLVNGMDIRKYGSQGQQRTAALSLKLSEIELVKQQIKDTPVLLLDDVLSELDRNRQTYLLNQVHGIQTLITCTGVDDFIQHNFQINKTFHVVAGGIK